MFLVVATGVFQTETLGEVVIDLNRTELPTASDCIFHHEVELRTVESSFALHLLCFQTFLSTSLYDCVLSEMPILVGADIFLLIIGIAE